MSSELFEMHLSAGFRELKNSIYTVHFCADTQQPKNEDQLNLKSYSKSDFIISISNEYGSEGIIQWIFMFICCMVAFAFVVAYMYFVRLKKENEVSRKTHYLIEKELKNRELSHHQLTKEIENRQNEFINYTLNVVHRSNVLENIVQSLANLKTTLPQEYHSKVNSILQCVQSLTNQEKDWMNFKNYFENSNGPFFDSLKKTYPEITQQELKICALSKLNLSLKEIASVLGISPESVKVTRSRLKKKLHLNRDEDFIAFLNNLKSETYT
ncbi:MAG: LuxR C-terminal-related transcriptional regulator [Chryseotalea sp.]